MSGVTHADLLRLFEATPREAIKQRQGPGGRMLDYIDARFVMDRLDDLLGPGNWQNAYDLGANGKVSCRIGINVEGEWVWKADGAGETDIEGEKGSFSDAFKRAAVHWGIGRDLYGASTSGTGRVTSPPPRPAAAPRPTVVRDAIEEPEGFGEAFGGGAASAADDFCPDHDLAWVLKPGGTSQRTGKDYDPFWACPSDERPFCKNKPTRSWQERRAS
jgi:hypothetical protein